MKKEEKRIEAEEKENKPSKEKLTEQKSESDEPVENKDQEEKSLEKNAENQPDESSTENSAEVELSEPIEEIITTKSVEDDSTSVRQRKPKSEEESKEDIPVVETIGQTERQTNPDVNDTEQTVDLENKKTD